MAELIHYQLSQDANKKIGGDIIPPSKYVDCYVLAAGAAKTVTVPTGARVAFFNATGNFYVNWLATAAEPVADITDGTGSDLNPLSRIVSGYSSFSILAPGGATVTIAYFS